VAVAIGIDGCKRGWFYFRYDNFGATFGVVAELADVLIDVSEEAIALVDIPIGLKDRGRQERQCDLAARVVLARRSSSVFPVPCRQALRAESYAEACVLNRKVLGRSLSKQSWAIMPGIRQADELMKCSMLARAVLREAHPEVCFWGLAGGPMAQPKRTREGFAERLRILQLFDPDAEGLIAAAFLAYGDYDAARDDIVDAFVLALCARAPTNLKTLPEKPPRDRRGLPMQITYLPGPGR
jgi:predicted RNase H-like nuclease